MCNEWMDIETAPKDGKDILVWSKSSGCTVVSWNSREGRWPEGFWDDGLTDEPWIETEHWMPLPAAPKEKP